VANVVYDRLKREYDELGKGESVRRLKALPGWQFGRGQCVLRRIGRAA
jgi:hypothetical protein